MKEIPLSGKLGTGKVALVGDEDYGYLAQWSWCLNNRGYVKRNVTLYDANGRRGYLTIYMHREVLKRMGFDLDRSETDHRNRNKLDNQRANLRTATRRQNCFNAGKKKSNRSGYKGVCRCQKGRGAYVVHIRIGGKKKHLGRFKTAEEAHAAYKQAAREHHGDFACV